MGEGEYARAHTDTVSVINSSSSRDGPRTLVDPPADRSNGCPGVEPLHELDGDRERSF